MSDSDDPKPMSQQEIDALFAQDLGGGQAAEPDQVEQAPADQAESTSAAAGPVDQAGIDAILNAMNGGDPADAADSSAPKTPSGPVDQAGIDAILAAMNGDESSDAGESSAPKTPSGPVDQAGIDAILNAMNGDDPADAAESAAPKTPSGPVDQAGIDAILAAMNGDDQAEPAAKTPSGPVDQAGIDAILASMSDDDNQAAAPAAAPAKTPSGPVGQDDIDAILAAMSGAGDNASTDSAAEGTPADPISGPVDQDAIDAILANMGAESVASEPDPPSAESSPPPTTGQAAIDDLLSQLSVETGSMAPAAETAENAAPAAADGPLGQDSIDDLLAEMGMNAGATAAPPTPPEPVAVPDNPEDSDVLSAADASPSGKVSQDAINDLLATLGQESADDPSQPPGPTDSERFGEPATQSLDTAKLKRIIDKHAEDDDPNDGTGMIDQDDIDALLAQLGDSADSTMAADLGPDPAPGPATIGEQMRAAPVAPVPQRTVADAIAPTMSMSMAGSMSSGPAGVLSSEELRGGRLLLMAVVCLLAMCGASLVMVIGAINDLTAELAEGRAAQIQPQDDFRSDVNVAAELLADENPVRRTKGAQFIETLQKRHRDEPQKYLELTVMLANHYRDQQAYKLANDQYENLMRQHADLIPDPQLYLEYARGLMASGQAARARQVVYTLIANEYYYVGEVDDDGTTRSEQQLVRHHEILRQAHIFLGTLYDDPVAKAGGPQVVR